MLSIGRAPWWITALLAGCAFGGPGDAFDDESEAGTTDPQAIMGGVEATDYPEAVLINMLAPQQSYCSGSLIAPRLVLTAGHCVLNFSSFEIIAPYANQSSMASQTALFDYAETGDNVNPNQHDVGVIFLDTPINIASYLKVAPQAVAFGTSALNLGRIDNGQLSQTGLFVSAPIPMQDGTSEGYPFDYSSNVIIEPGDSGGPVVLEGAAPRTVIAVNSGAGQGSQILARVDLVYAWLQDQILTSGGGGGGGGMGAGGGGVGGGPGGGGPGGGGPSGAGGGGAGGQGPPPPPPGSNCNPCMPGPALDPYCDPCINALCGYDPYCCSVEVDEVCIEEVQMICGPVCGP